MRGIHLFSLSSCPQTPHIQKVSSDLFANALQVNLGGGARSFQHLLKEWTALWDDDDDNQRLAEYFITRVYIHYVI